MQRQRQKRNTGVLRSCPSIYLSNPHLENIAFLSAMEVVAIGKWRCTVNSEESLYANYADRLSGHRSSDPHSALDSLRAHLIRLHPQREQSQSSPPQPPNSPRRPREQPTTAPEQPTAVSEQPTAAPEEPTATPEQASEDPDQGTEDSDQVFSMQFVCINRSLQTCDLFAEYIDRVMDREQRTT